MAVNAYPWETQDTTETQYQRILRETQDPGVVDAIGGSSLACTIPGGSMRVNVANGYFWSRGLVLEVTGGTEFVTLDAGGTSARADLIVARFDATNNAGTLAVKKGTSTALPALTDTTNLWEEPLASVSVGAGVTTLSAANLTDRRSFTGGRVGVWTTDTRPGTRGTPTPRRGTLGLNVSTNLWEVYDGGWKSAAAYLRLVDLILPTARLANVGGSTPLAPAFNLLDGSRVHRSDSAPTSADGQDWDIWLEY